MNNVWDVWAVSGISRDSGKTSVGMGQQPALNTYLPLVDQVSKRPLVSVPGRYNHE